MPRTRLLPLIVCVLALLVLARPSPAHADEVAPALEPVDLRAHAEAELRRLLGTLPEADRRRLAGTYVAFDASAADPIAQVACDDDGDHVVLLSGAMLRLVALVAATDALDEQDGGDRVARYAAFVARAQVPGRRLLPPPPGLFPGGAPSTAADARLLDVLAFLVASELARLDAGDLACPSPTMTREHGDATWTAGEARAAERARSIYAARQGERDLEALARAREVGRAERGALAFLRFFAVLERESADAGARFAPSYARLHPSAALRVASIARAPEPPSTGAAP